MCVNMAAPCGDEFDGWLSEKLQKINPDVDLEVFVTYIKGVLETDTDDEEKEDSISGILGEITEDGLTEHCAQIQERWEEMNKAQLNKQQQKGDVGLDEKLASIMEKANLSVVKQKELTPEARARKAAILAQYGHVSDGEASETEDGPHDGATGTSDDLAKNTNAVAVQQREKDQRERSRQEAEKKKAKDKEDREKQKQKAGDRKEKEKVRTQKGERRR